MLPPHQGGQISRQITRVVIPLYSAHRTRDARSASRGRAPHESWAAPTAVCCGSGGEHMPAGDATGERPRGGAQGPAHQWQHQGAGRKGSHAQQPIERIVTTRREPRMHAPWGLSPLQEDQATNIHMFSVLKTQLQVLGFTRMSKSLGGGGRKQAKDDSSLLRSMNLTLEKGKDRWQR